MTSLTNVDLKRQLFETIEFSAHQPSDFIQTNQVRILPSWSNAVESVLVFLQHAPCDFSVQTETTEHWKSKLRQNFLRFGRKLITRFQEEGHFAVLIDPCTGFPLNTQSGSLTLSDVSIVKSLLHFSTELRGDCLVLIHPRWGDAVYPSTILSTASPSLAEYLTEPMLIDHYQWS